ncbi:MAG: OmpH family outer membrane protein [Desulfovibrio sp.]|jgi:Skp family chaperone for outer membrane proteins|nr:OmpH family outer membrane protein [Desulfovibrio sp.]
MLRNIRGPGLALLLLPALAGCPGEDNSLSFATVDVEHVMRDSRAARDARAHVEAAKERLLRGWRELQEAAKSEPEEQRQKTLAQGLRTLQQQVKAEEIGARQIVNDLMLEEVKKWRRANKVGAVIARHNLLDASGARDVTRAVIEAMDAREARFAELPVVTVTPPDKPEAGGGAAGEKKTPAATDGPARRNPPQNR